ncbi:peptidylprolyl isomerase [Flammeovirgaceae bacterium SG7u.111]|nr:peptidylprolyl isomerase [Flammeovirgaceae bacterium SG7u.132]WPO34752.1 peptidylprolyl isomerase [Flammeovirgaceae bacterium SG7u.111]
MNKLKLALCFVLLGLIASPSFAQSKKKKKSKKDEVVMLSTSYGTIHILLYDETPLHKANFLKLAKEGFYDSLIFHRVLKDFVVQGGDPNSRPGTEGEVGKGGPGYTVEAEIVESLKHDYGAIGAARQGDRMNPERRSSGSQFYIVQAKDGSHHLDDSYTVFGTVIKGMEAVDKIAEQNVRRGGRPVEDIRMAMKVVKLSKKKITKLYEYQFPE